MPATLEEIARRVGCSIATVSRALNNSGQVSEKMHRAIVKAVQETRYRPRRPELRNLAMPVGTTRLVDVVVHAHLPMERVAVHGDQLEVIEKTEAYPPADILSAANRLSNSFYRSIVDGVVDELGRWGFRGVLMPNRNLLDEAFLEELAQSRSPGVLLIGQTSPDTDSFLAKCSRPVVVIDQHVASRPRPPVVTIDNFEGIDLAFKHVYDLGHRAIGFLTGPDESAYRERESAYRHSMSRADLTVREKWIYRGVNQIEASAAWLSKRLRNADRPTAFLCANDVLAFGMVRAASELGVRIPSDVSLVGFDDVEPSEIMTPPLTTVRAPTVEMGRQAVRQLMIEINLKDRPPGPPTTLRVMPELVVRASTARCLKKR